MDKDYLTNLARQLLAIAVTVNDDSAQKLIIVADDLFNKAKQITNEQVISHEYYASTNVNRAPF